MEKKKTYTYQGFTFASEAELNEAKKEAEVVSYIRSQADLGNTKTVIKLYNRLIEKGTLVTVLGISFLQELRSRALESGAVAGAVIGKYCITQRDRTAAFQQDRSAKTRN